MTVESTHAAMLRDTLDSIFEDGDPLARQQVVRLKEYLDAALSEAATPLDATASAGEVRVDPPQQRKHIP